MTLKNFSTFNHSILGVAFEHNFDGRGGGGELKWAKLQKLICRVGGGGMLKFQIDRCITLKEIQWIAEFWVMWFCNEGIELTLKKKSTGCPLTVRILEIHLSGT